MTDPQDDVLCRGCETEGPPSRLGHDGLCPDCQIPELRLMSDLAALGVFATRNEDGSVRVADVLTVDVETDGSWCISGSDHETWTAPEAIAAIVQAPGLRAELRQRHRFIQTLQNVRTITDMNVLVEELFRLRGQVEVLTGNPGGPHVRYHVEQSADEPLSDLTPLLLVTAERDTLAAENARLVAELEKPQTSAWKRGLGGFVRWASDGRVAAAAGSESGWDAYHDRKTIAGGPESGNAGMHAADLALLAAGYRLIGGVHPAQGEVPNG